MNTRTARRVRPAVIAGVLAAAAVVGLGASSHREAPGITGLPKLDGTDFYMFRSYETGREAFVTFVANYVPLQDPYGGPNYFMLDPHAIYTIHVDRDGDAIEDISFAFTPTNTNRGIALTIGGQSVPVPVINVGAIGPDATDTAALNVVETIDAYVVRGGSQRRTAEPITDADTGAATFRKPVDNIGQKSIPDYAAYARSHIRPIAIPGCADGGRLFVGQRKDPFVVNLGEVFDLVNVSNPLGAENAEADDLADKNVTSFVLEVPISCLASSSAAPVIGAWTTASLKPVKKQDQMFMQQYKGATQVSRLGHPLVNEVVIGLKDKDAFNGSHPANDGQFARYVTNPTLPAILELLFGDAGIRAPTLFPRADLVQVFLTGVPSLNQQAKVTPSEMLRLNTAIMPVPAAAQHRLGVLGGDTAGFPNGRRPGDDVVDAALRVVMGALLPADIAPSGQLPFTDGAFVDASYVDAVFPYLRTPLPGSPNATPGTR
jgi:hypothetical protein